MCIAQWCMYRRMCIQIDSKIFVHSLHFITQFSVPPTVVALDDDQEIITNESESAVLSFRIDRAAPPVPVEDIRWIYSADFSMSPDGGVDITNLTSRTSDLRLSFSADLLTLTINNIVQARALGEETDQGRYFLVAYHPAGNRFSYIDVVVNSKFTFLIDATLYCGHPAM